jgi:hypothetical protein
MGLFELLAEPGSRQAVIASTAVAIGAINEFVHYRIVRNTPFATVSAAESEEKRHVERVKHHVDYVLAGILTAYAILNAVQNGAPLNDSYTLEVITDAAVAMVGLQAGKMAIQAVNKAYEIAGR